ncbi:MAG TPA: sigma factor-like helix-turn-helix DNA-binding protein [Sphingobium sp.]|uniref:RNA polymerase sigma factor n=1 Tax=Sphingobium sp. TaxID=1912891 RepID=UPI002ED3C70E
MRTDRESLIAALDRLPQLARIVYLLSSADGFSYPAIAFRLGTTVEEVEGHLTDALYLLRSYLREEPPP